MDPAILLGIAIGIAVLVALAWPFFRREAPQGARSQNDLYSDALETEKHYVYASIVDHDSDFKAGKLEEREYLRLREVLLKDAARLLAQIDELGASSRKAKS